jgi:hypothetical protein
MIDLDNFFIALRIIKAAFRDLLVMTRSVWMRNPKEASYSVSLIRGFETDHAGFIIEGRMTWAESPGRDLKPLLKHSRICETTDPWDKVYASLGLADPGYDIKPDYRLSSTLEQMFVDTAHGIIEYEQCSDVLSHAYERDRTPGLPSWVPYWSSKEGRRLLK